MFKVLAYIYCEVPVLLEIWKSYYNLQGSEFSVYRSSKTTKCVVKSVWVRRIVLVIASITYLDVTLETEHQLCTRFYCLRWLETVSSTFQDLEFDGSLQPLYTC